MQAYSDPKRASEPHALPDVEVFYISHTEAAEKTRETHETWDRGWYWWSCFPGCMPESDPMGPFATEAEALADAQSGCEESEEHSDAVEARAREWCWNNDKKDSK